MTQLLLDWLGTTRSSANDDSVRAGRQQRRALSGILEWAQWFATYMAICSRNQPHRIQDFLGYQTQASLEYQGDGWLGYDWRFQQRAPANPALVWANINTTLWNLAFAGQASASHCCHCFCLAHTTDQCDWAPDPQPLMSPHMTSYQYLWHPTSIRNSSSYLHYARPGTMTHTHIAPFPTALIGILILWALFQ